MRTRFTQRMAVGAVLVLGVPTIAALSWAQDTPVATDSTPGPISIVAEQVATARDIVPFGVSRAGELATVWATGKTRAPSTEAPGPPPPSTPEIPTTPGGPESGSGVVVPAAERGERALRFGAGRPFGEVAKAQADALRARAGIAPAGATAPAAPGTQGSSWAAAASGRSVSAGSQPLAGSATTAATRAAEPTTPTAPAPTTPADTVLLAGNARGIGGATAWSRTALPLDAADRELTGRDWRPAGGDAPLHAGEATPKGAAAIAIELGLADAATRGPALLARRAADGRFRVLPSPSAALLAPSTALFDAGSRTARVPIAVVDLPRAAGASDPPSGDTSPPAGTTGTTGTTPEDGPAAPAADTGVLLAPPGGDGVLAWTGTAWREEPYLDLAGDRPAEGRTPIALAATPNGDGLALLRNSDTASPERFRLYRRLPNHSAWREIAIPDGSLLRGALPASIAAVDATPAPGDPLTMTAGHWWVDLVATRRDTTSEGEEKLVKVSATVHLTPGRATPAATTPAATTPAATPEPTTPATDPADPTTTSPTPAPTSTPTPTPTPTTPQDWLAATPTGTWCQPTIARCTHALSTNFTSSRGYRSFAFPGANFGGRIITSPVIPEATGTAAQTDASASGGYLALSGRRFTIRSGAGDEGDGASDTESAVFEREDSGWVGADRAVGHVGRFTGAADGTVADESSVAVVNDPDFNLNAYDAAQDVAISPDGKDVLALGAAGQAMNASMFLKRGDAHWRYADAFFLLVNFMRGSDGPGPPGTDEGPPAGLEPVARAIAWPRTDVVAIVGTGGLMIFGEVPRVFDENLGSRPPTKPTRVAAAEGLDLLDVAFAPGGPSDPIDGWAVGRDGAAIRCVNLQCERAPLAGALETADLRQVAYSGDDVLVASSTGLLRSRDGTLELDPDLAAMIEADGRPAGVRTVAGLPDGAAVVDARYYRLSQAGPWLRLPSPTEGDVIALALARQPGQDGLASLRVLASIADAVPDRRGSLPDPQRQFGEDPDGKPIDRTYQALLEVPPRIDDARLTQLEPAGWVDRARVPLERNQGDDLSVLPRPVTAIDLSGTGEGRSGWAVGGWGSSAQFKALRQPTGFGGRVSFDLSRAPAAAPELGPEAASPQAADGRAGPRAGTGATRAQEAAPTTSTTPAESAPPPTSGPRDDDLPGDNSRVRVLIGGHPACLSECAGRSDQRVGPDANLQQALAAAKRIRLGRGGSPPVSAMLIGGGRAAVGTTPDQSIPLSGPGADAYAEMLGGTTPYASSPPVFPVIGTGDASTAVGRQNFAERVAPVFAPAPEGAPPGESPMPPGSPGNGTVAYWFELAGSPKSIRIIAIDNATGPIRGGITGPQADWLRESLAYAKVQGKPTIVVGSVRLDNRSRVEAPVRDAQLALFAEGGASAYVSTDGDDDPSDLTQFGPRVRQTLAATPVGQLPVIHSAALGHSLPSRLIFAGNGPMNEEQYREIQKQLVDLIEQPALVALDIDQTQPGKAPGTVSVRASLIPVFRSLSDLGVSVVERSYAQPVYLPTQIDASNGFRWTDPNEPALGEQDVGGGSIGNATPDQCGLFGGGEECGGALPTDVRFEVADPSIAVFVRARAATQRKDSRGRPIFAAPIIVLDKDGNPVVDSKSTIICPIRAGTTTVRVSTAGRTHDTPLRVVEPPPRANSTPAATGKSPCGFGYFRSSDVKQKDPPASAPKPDPGPGAQPLPDLPPQPNVDPRPNPMPTVPVTRPPLLGLIAPPPLVTYIPPMADSARPPVAPNPKPITPPVPPAPPSGVSTQQVPAPNVQNVIVGVKQEERQTEVAREGADHQATVYKASPRPDATTLLAGGALALLIAAGGSVAGRRRRLARAARSWLR